MVEHGTGRADLRKTLQIREDEQPSLHRLRHIYMSRDSDKCFSGSETSICKAACSSVGCAELVLSIVVKEQSFVTSRAGVWIRDFGQEFEHAR